MTEKRQKSELLPRAKRCLTLIESEMINEKNRSMARPMCGVLLKDWKKGLRHIVTLNKTMDQLAMTNSMCHLRAPAEDERRSSLEKCSKFEVEGQRREKKIKSEIDENWLE